MRIRKVGKWQELARIMQTMHPRYVKAARRALLQEAQFLRTKMVQGISSGAPGGRAFRPHSAVTRLLRQADGFGGTKIMMRSAGLRNSITVVEEGSGPIGGTIFVGVHKTARGPAGKPMVNIAAVHEFGMAIKMTAKMRAYLFARMREAGIQAARKQAGRAMAGAQRTMLARIARGRARTKRAIRAFVWKGIDTRLRKALGRKNWASAKRVGRTVGKGIKTVGKGVRAGSRLTKSAFRSATKAFFGSNRSRIGGAGGGAAGRSGLGAVASGRAPGGRTKGFVVIPPRPFVQPIVDVYAQPDQMVRRIYQSLARSMSGDFGRV